MNKIQPIKTKSAPIATTPSSSLTLAELCLQRADFPQAKSLLEKRISRGSNDFKTKNLLGISHSQLGNYPQAIEIFSGLIAQTRRRAPGEKATFNLGLAHFYQDLTITGDCSVAKSRQILPGMGWGQVRQPLTPFEKAIDIWKNQIRQKSAHRDLILTYMSFAHLQAGNLEAAIEGIINAMNLNENFYITHFVLGRIFLDLFHLAEEGSDYLLTRKAASFFEVEDYEIVLKKGDRVAVQKETYLDIALQAFLEARSLNYMAPEVHVPLSQTYLLAGMYEESQECLAQAESLSQDSPAIIEMSLQFYEAVGSSPEVIRSLVNKIKGLRLKGPQREVNFILPPYYLS